MKTPTSTSRSLPKIEADLRAAGNYGEWLALAEEHDRVSGAADWREDERTDLLHVPEIRNSILRLREMREPPSPKGRLFRCGGEGQTESSAPTKRFDILRREIFRQDKVKRRRRTVCTSSRF